RNEELPRSRLGSIQSQDPQKPKATRTVGRDRFCQKYLNSYSLYRERYHNKLRGQQREQPVVQSIHSSQSKSFQDLRADPMPNTDNNTTFHWKELEPDRK